MNKLTINLISKIKERNPQVAEFLVNAYSGSNIDPAALEQTLSFLSANSAIISSVLASPGSAVISELLYDQLDTDSFIDKYFYNSKGGQAVRGRLEAMQEHLLLLSERFLKKQNEVAIGSLGSGPGRYIINTILRLREKGYMNSVKAFCFDTDENALLRGKRNAVSHKVEDSVKFKRADFNRNLSTYYRNKFDILVLKGVLCPYDSRGCSTLIEHVTIMLKERGILIASNVSKKMPDEDPFTCFLMNNVANWVMNYKDEAELQTIFENAGLKWEGSFTDDLGFHIMGIGRAERSCPLSCFTPGPERFREKKYE